MLPQTAHTVLSPAELSFLHTSLSQDPPIRPDLRHASQFRPVLAESGILPPTNGSARVCFSDGTEAIVGIKAEVEKTTKDIRSIYDGPTKGEVRDDGKAEATTDGLAPDSGLAAASSAWIDLSIDIPGQRDDDPLTIFLSTMLKEALQSSSHLLSKLHLNERWHWHLYIDILLLSQPLSYPLPLLSLTTHLTLLDTRLPRRTSDPEDDPLFDDDWDAAVPLYDCEARSAINKPPVTLLVVTLGDNVVFDPSQDELMVAENVLAVSVTSPEDAAVGPKVTAIRMIDAPSRLTPLGIPQAVSTGQTQVAGQGGRQTSDAQAPTGATRDLQIDGEKGAVWSPPRGGLKRQMLTKIIKMVTEKGDVGEEVLNGLASIRS